MNGTLGSGSVDCPLTFPEDYCAVLFYDCMLLVICCVFVVVLIYSFVQIYSSFLRKHTRGSGTPAEVDLNSSRTGGNGVFTCQRNLEFIVKFESVSKG
jgi:hypothetical protein